MIEILKNIIRKYLARYLFDSHIPSKYFRESGLYFSAFLCMLILSGIGTNKSMALPSSSDLRGLVRPFEKKVEPKSKLGPQAPEQREALPNSELKEYKFILNKLLLQGSSVYTSKETFSIYSKYLGKEISLETLYKIRDAITFKYRSDGYLLSRAVIPEQRIKNGLVKIRIIEGFIDSVEIKGDYSISRDEILTAQANRIKKSKPLRNNVLERSLLILNEVPGLNVTTFLRPSKETFAASKLTIIANEKGPNSYWIINNRGSQYGGPLNISFGLNFNDILGKNSSTGFSANTADPIGELFSTSLYHDIAIGNDGTRLRFSLDYALSKPGHDLAEFDIEAKNGVISGIITKPIIRSRGKNLAISFGLAKK